MTVMLVAVLVLGYVLIWAIWHYGFKGRADEQAHEPVAEPLNRSGRSLEQELRAFESWLRDQPAPEGLAASWQRIAVFDADRSTGGDLEWAQGREIQPTGFGERFTEILAGAQRDAVRMSAVTVDGGCLIVGLEWWSRPENPGEPRRARLPVAVTYGAWPPVAPGTSEFPGATTGV